MKDEIALVCANFGQMDNIKPLPPHPGITAFYYHDGKATDPRLKGKLDGWDHILLPNYPRYDFNDRLRGRYFKHQIHRLDEVQDYRWLVWMDGSVWLKDVSILHTWKKHMSEVEQPQDRITLVQHPQRKSPREEYEYIQQHIDKKEPYLTARYEHEKMTEQMKWMGERGWDTNTLLACGTIWMVENNPAIHASLDEWWDQQLRFGMMDQLTFTPILKKNGHTPLVCDLNVWNNPYWIWTAHWPKELT